MKAAVLGVALLTSLAAYAFDSPYHGGEGRYPRFESKQAEPGLSYGHVQDLPLPKTLLYGVTPDELLSDAEAWVERGYGGFFLTGVAGEWSSDIWAVDGEPWTIGEADATLKKVRQATARCDVLGADVFLTTSFSHPFDWFSDTAWQHIVHRFRQMAIFARDSGCAGLAIDIEYINAQYHFNWEGYTYDGYTRADVVAKMRERMTTVAEAMYNEFPDMVLLTLPEGMFALGSHLQTAWIETAAKRDAPGGVHICTEYTYRRTNIRYMFGHTQMNLELLRRMLSPDAQAYWRERCSFAAGMWPFGVDPDDYHGDAPSAEEFQQAFAASLMLGSRYNWIYSHNMKDLLMGGAMDGYAPADAVEQYVDVVAQCEVVTDARFVDAAQAIRRAAPLDTESVLGISIVPTFVGPREEAEVGQMPAALYTANPISALRDRLWEVGMRVFNGEELDLRQTFGTRTEWLLSEPFENIDGKGFDKASSPETAPEAYKRWAAFRAPERCATVNLAAAMTPAESVCAYAMCYVRSPVARDVQIRLGANDTWKLWLDDDLVYECPEDGRVILDREIVPATLDAGVTRILLKVCNNRKDWGFVFRICGESGENIPDLEYSLKP